MKHRRLPSLKAQLALTSGLVLLFAGCQTLTPTKSAVTSETVTGGKAVGGAKTPGAQTPGATGTGDQAAPLTFDAKVVGTVTDAAGKPVPNVQINSFNGATAVSGADGKFELAVVGQDDMVVDFAADGYLPRQLVTGVVKNGTAEVTAVLKPLDANVVKVDPAKANTITSSDGASVLDIPAGALASGGAVRVTWMNPIASAAFPESYGELPGPLTTQAKDGPPLSISPLGFSTVDFLDGAMLKPGAQATLKMKVEPKALEMARNLNIPIDFANPTTLQQPCYEYDRATGLWVNPATSKLEQDAAGNVWFVYTMHGQEAPKNYTVLQESVSQGGFKTGERTVKVPKYKTTYTVTIGGGGTKTFTSAAARDAYCKDNFCADYSSDTTVTYVDKIEDIFGKYFNGSVNEKSSNDRFDGKGIDGAVVHHAADWFRNTTKRTDGQGNFSIPVSHEAKSHSVSGASWRGAESNGGGYTMKINTDGKVHANVLGGSVTLDVDGPAGSTIVGGRDFGGDVTRTASRDAVVTVKDPAGAAYLSGGDRKATVPVDGTANLGTIKVVHDATGSVIERVGANPDNARTPHQADGSGLAGATVTFGGNDAITGDATTGTGGDGGFKFTYLNNQAFPGTVKADYKGFVSANGGGSPYRVELKTDATLTLALKGTFGADQVGQSATVTYKVDGESYTKTVSLAQNGQIGFTFCRDKNDDHVVFELVSVETVNMVSSKPLPKVTLTPGGEETAEVRLVIKAEAVKYHQ